VREYAEKFYLPAKQRGEMLGADGLARSIVLAGAKDGLRGKWGGIRIVAIQSSGNGHYKVGQSMQVDAMLDLPGIDPREVTVQLYCGPINATGEIENPQVLTMNHVREMAPGRHLFAGSVNCSTSGRQGYAVRIVPGLPDQATEFEPGLISWN